MHSGFAFILLFLLQCALADNPVKTPIIQNAMDVYTRMFAQLPNTDGSPAKIVCIIPQGDDLYVCTLKIIYRVKPDGSHSVFLNVDEAFKQATGRGLNYNNKAHGGVRSIAFHPWFDRNHLIYISAMEDRPSDPSAFNYISDVSNPIAADSVVVEYTVNKTIERPIISSYRLVFRIGMPVFDHPIKQMAFKATSLYIAHGDGSVQSAITGGGQGNDALGKILRINPRKQRGGAPYGIPRSNPFVNDPNMKSEVWALGFRNPHHICFSKTGRLFVADAGRANVEEINIVRGGRNYGWSEREGTFVHLPRGGLITGVKRLPPNDCKLGFEYPVAQVGHEGQPGDRFVGQAVAGGCPVENGSPMDGHYFYSDFPKSGNLYFSTLSEMFSARTRARPKFLTQARTRQAKIFYDHDNDPATPPQQYDSLGDAMRSEPGRGNQRRVDVRFGRGSNGELYWSSKRSGRVYLFTSSLPGGPGGPTPTNNPEAVEPIPEALEPSPEVLEFSPEVLESSPEVLEFSQEALEFSLEGAEYSPEAVDS